MTPARLAALMEASWPPARRFDLGPVTLRDGQGGGKRVSAATCDRVPSAAELDAAEAGMARLDQPALFLIRAGDEALDAVLAARGYGIVDPVVAYAGPAATLAEPAPPPLAAFPHWPPLAVTAALWAEGGIGPARIAVMERARGPKTAILARAADRPVGAAFVACDGDAAMLHALEVAPAARRQGSARAILRVAAGWARDQGAATLALVVTRGNSPARGLYASLGMQIVGQYHYRQK